ncbi:N-myc-interactor [Notolabrus celidotus]|uniref:N-myc-interactor n=1 Tax=Notolabrus celidotus TaxID=1203425 RepID=UPI001490647D|nr:N-myc-interactor [Notolabrus celidotus]XP_034550550.1 N-myc-interactor [Notolabrus celidotus]XP_034550551.1 N-myc-interactor [Notolabrus celidotus]
MTDMTKNGEAPMGLKVPGEENLQLQEAKKELEEWKNKTKEAENMKAKLTLEELNEEEVKTKAQGEMMALSFEQKQLKEEFTKKQDEVQREINNLSKRKRDLMDQLKEHEDQLLKRKREFSKLQEKFKIYAKIPDTEVVFTGQSDEQVTDDEQPIRAEFVISQRPSVLLEGGQALITFEEDTVAAKILKIGKFSVSCESEILDLKSKKINLDPAVKFEVHLQVSRTQLRVSEVPHSMPEERIKDRLMISFCRPSRGGGEVKEVEYDQNTGTASITFLHPGVADSLALKGEYFVDLDSEVKVQVEPVDKYQLRKFQTFCGFSERTVLFEGIVDVLDQEDLQDHLEIHFQKPRNHGGEIENVQYVSGKTGQVRAFFTCEEE